MSDQTKIKDLLNPLCLQQMYEGEESGILLILGKKVISDRYIRLRARDARYEDNVICDVKLETSAGSQRVYVSTFQIGTVL